MIHATLNNIINTLANLFILVIIIDSIVSYFLSPYHPVRNFLDKIVTPFLEPVRRIVPSLGVFDLSPLILIILVELVASLLTRFL